MPKPTTQCNLHTHFNNNCKYHWLQFSSQKTQTDWIKKRNPSICCLQETHLSFKEGYHPRVKGWEKVFQSSGTRKKVGIIILIADKIDVILKLILIKGTVTQEDITVLKSYTPHSGTPNFIFKKCATAFKDISPLIVGGFHVPLSPIERSSGQKIN